MVSLREEVGWTPQNRVLRKTYQWVGWLPGALLPRQEGDERCRAPRVRPQIKNDIAPEHREFSVLAVVKQLRRAHFPKTLGVAA